MGRSSRSGSQESSSGSRKTTSLPKFPLGLALKDVDLALAEGDRDRFSVLAALSKEWTGIAEQGLGTEDITIVTKVLAG